MGKYAEYMILGYASMAVLLSGMIAWIYWRYRTLFQEEALLDQYEAEEHGDRVASSVGAMEEDVLPGETSPGMTDAASPSEPIVHSLPKGT
jgi:heme exporter protein CcmD